MEDNEDNFIKKKKLLMKLNSGHINKKLLYYINEARSCPKDFSRHLMVNDDVDEMISNLSLFFKYSSVQVPPLMVNPNLEKSSQDLLYHIISIDDGSSTFKFNKEEKERNCLKERLKRLNLIPTYHIDLLIIGVDDSIEALSDILINKSHRKKILSPQMKYIGIASGLLPSEKLCIVIDIVSSFKIYDTFLYQKINYSNYNNRPNKYSYIICTGDDDDDDIESFYNNDNDEEELYKSKITNSNNNYNFNESSYNDYIPIYNSDYKKYNKKRIFNSVGQTPFPNTINEDYANEDNRFKNFKKDKKKDEIDLRISKQKCYSPSNGPIFRKVIYYERPKEFKIPVSVSIEKKYAKDRVGKIYPIYSRETKYDDGSILIQPYFDEYNDDI